MTLANGDDGGLDQARRSAGSSATDLDDRAPVKAARQADGAGPGARAFRHPARTGAGGPAEATRRASRAFSSLRTRNYRLFATGQVISNTGSWMQRVAQDWLVLDLTHNSGPALGITTGLQFAPMLFSLWGGAVADRYPKRSILMVTQALMGGLALVLGVLALTGTVQIWQVYLLAFALGM